MCAGAGTAWGTRSPSVLDAQFGAPDAHEKAAAGIYGTLSMGQALR